MSADVLAGARIAVTGASGFVGGRVAVALVARGAHVEAHGRRPVHRIEGATYTAWDIAEGPLANAPRVDAVVHCAGMVSDWGPRRDFVRCHVDGTAHVLASFPEPCPVLLVSSASVYDPFVAKHMCREDAPMASRYLNAYSETKARSEQLVRMRSRHVVLRPHAIYGPGDRVLVPRILEAFRGGRLLAAGDGNNLVSLTHVDNLVDASLLALEALLRGDAGGVFNIADDMPLRIDDVLRAVLAATGRSPRLAYLPRALAYGLGAVLELVCAALRAKQGPRLTRYRVVQIADEYTLDLRRAKALLGYAPTRNVHDFLASGALAADHRTSTSSGR